MAARVNCGQAHALYPAAVSCSALPETSAALVVSDCRLFGENNLESAGITTLR